MVKNVRESKRKCGNLRTSFGSGMHGMDDLVVYLHSFICNDETQSPFRDVYRNINVLLTCMGASALTTFQRKKKLCKRQKDHRRGGVVFLACWVIYKIISTSFIGRCPGVFSEVLFSTYIWYFLSTILVAAFLPVSKFINLRALLTSNCCFSKKWRNK